MKVKRGLEAGYIQRWNNCLKLFNYACTECHVFRRCYLNGLVKKMCPKAMICITVLHTEIKGAICNCYFHFLIYKWMIWTHWFMKNVTWMPQVYLNCGTPSEPYILSLFYSNGCKQMKCKQTPYSLKTWFKLSFLCHGWSVLHRSVLSACYRNKGLLFQIWIIPLM